MPTWQPVRYVRCNHTYNAVVVAGSRPAALCAGLYLLSITSAGWGGRILFLFVSQKPWYHPGEDGNGILEEHGAGMWWESGLVRRQIPARTQWGTQRASNLYSLLAKNF